MPSLTEFQTICEHNLEELLATHGRKLERREVIQGETQTYVTAQIGGTELHVWIYEDEAQFEGEGLDCRYEAPDYDSPGDLIEAFVTGVSAYLQGSDPYAVKNRPFPQRLGFAMAGLAAAWRRERSFRTQVWSAGLVVLALVALRPPAVWWSVILLTVGLVLVAELFNAAVEALVDHLHPDRHPEIRKVKDMAAGAALVASLAAAAIGAAFAVSLVF